MLDEAGGPVIESVPSGRWHSPMQPRCRRGVTRAVIRVAGSNHGPVQPKARRRRLRSCELGRPPRRRVRRWRRNAGGMGSRIADTPHWHAGIAASGSAGGRAVEGLAGSGFGILGQLPFWSARGAGVHA